jgi:hypothetical protein
MSSSSSPSRAVPASGALSDLYCSYKSRILWSVGGSRRSKLADRTSKQYRQWAGLAIGADQVSSFVDYLQSYLWRALRKWIGQVQ